MASKPDAQERTKQYEKRAIRRKIRQLHSAIADNRIEDVRDLLTPDVDVNFHYNGQSALQIAVINGYTEICKFLLENEADVDKHNAEDNNLLNMAAWRGHTEIVQALLEYKPELDLRNNHGATALNTAAYRGHVEIARLLVNADCDVNKPNNRLQTPLLTCAKEDRIDVAQVLINADCLLDDFDSDRKTPLIVAAEKGYVEMVKLLIKAGCNLNACEKYHCTALFLASKHGHSKIVEELISAQANLDMPDTKDCTPLIEAIRGQHQDIVKKLIAAGCNTNYPERETKQGPIHAAVRQASHFFGPSDTLLSMVKLLMESDCNLNAADKQGWTPLYQSAFAGEIEITKLLINQGVNVDCITDVGNNPLHGAMYGNKPEIVELLIDAGAKINAINKRCELPLYTAVDMRADFQIIRHLLKAGSMTDLRESESRHTPLFTAIQQDYNEAATALIEAGCDVNIPDKNGDTPLWMACYRGNEEIVNSLLAHPKIEMNAGITHIPLHIAAFNNYRTIVESLLQAGCNVNQMTDLCTTALYFAAEANNVPLTKLLLKYGANPSAPYNVKLPKRCCKHYTDKHPHLESEPLYGAVKNDNFMLVKLILTATPHMPYWVINTLKDLIFRTGYSHEARMDEKTLRNFSIFFTGILSRPRSLQEECRAIVRASLGQKPSEKVEQLPIPAKLKDFVLIKELLG